ncbi:MAG: hypothetical protein R2690_08450 [Acidimicrobiales bacterium]
MEWYLEAIAEQVGEAEADLRRSMGEVLVVVLGMMSDGYRFGREFLAVWLAVREGKVTNKDYRTRYDLNLWIGHPLEGAAYLPR